MSSQGLNAASFNANTNYLFVPGLAGIPQGFRIQSSSDYIKQLRQQRQYASFLPTIQPVKVSSAQSNSFYLDARVSQQTCPDNACAGGPFSPYF
jgi:hypothetical protein